jgi:hypothetical protein
MTGINAEKFCIINNNYDIQSIDWLLFFISGLIIYPGRVLSHVPELTIDSENREFIA